MAPVPANTRKNVPRNSAESLRVIMVVRFHFCYNRFFPFTELHPSRSLCLDFSRTLGGIKQSCGVGLKNAADFIAHPAEHLQLFLLRSGSMGRIIKTPEMAMGETRKGWAYLIRIAADKDGRGDLAIEKFIDVFGSMPREINADFRHHFDAQWMHIARWFRSSTCHHIPLTQGRAQDALSDVGTTTISGAKNENAMRFHKKE
jgi:hypothetical protein